MAAAPLAWALGVLSWRRDLRRHRHDVIVDGGGDLAGGAEISHRRQGSPRYVKWRDCPPMPGRIRTGWRTQGRVRQPGGVAWLLVNPGDRQYVQFCRPVGCAPLLGCAWPVAYRRVAVYHRQAWSVCGRLHAMGYSPTTWPAQAGDPGDRSVFRGGMAVPFVRRLGPGLSGYAL